MRSVWRMRVKLAGSLFMHCHAGRELASQFRYEGLAVPAA